MGSVEYSPVMAGSCTAAQCTGIVSVSCEGQCQGIVQSGVDLYCCAEYRSVQV